MYIYIYVCVCVCVDTRVNVAYEGLHIFDYLLSKKIKSVVVKTYMPYMMMYIHIHLGKKLNTFRG